MPIFHSYPRRDGSRLWILLLGITLQVSMSGIAFADVPGPPPMEGSAPVSASASSKNLDARIFHAINLKPGHHDALDPMFRMLMPLGDRSAIVIPVGLYAWGRLSDDKNLRESGVFTAAAMASSALATEAIKGLVARRRPVEKFGDNATRVVGKRIADGRSFPSGHASNAFAWATVLSDLYPDNSALFFGTASAIAVGRVRLGAHYPSDVIAGALIGYLAGRLVVSNRDLILRKEEPSPGGSTMGISRRFYF